MNQTGMEIVRPDFLPVSVSLISRDRESRSFRASFDGGLLVMQISFSVRPKHAWAKAHFHGRFFPRASRLAPRTEAPGLPPVFARLKARCRAPFEAQGELEARGFQL